MIRKIGLFLVMLGALSLSFHGQVASVAPLLGKPLGVVFALTFDLASLLALHAATSGGSKRVRRWSWVVLLHAGGTALGLNTWYALSTRKLPMLAAVAVGAGPVLLAWALSHLIALVLTERTSTTSAVTAADAGSASRTASEVIAEAVSVPMQMTVSSPTAPSAPPALDSTNRHIEHTNQPPTRAPAPAVDELVEQAERLERQALAISDGARGISYREATRRLRVRYPTARAAVDAARSRMTAIAPLPHERPDTASTRAGSTGSTAA